MIKKGKEKGTRNKKETKKEERTSQTKGKYNKIDECSIGFKINFDLLQISKGNKRRMAGKTKKRKQRNTKFKLKHIN